MNWPEWLEMEYADIHHALSTVISIHSRRQRLDTMLMRKPHVSLFHLMVDSRRSLTTKPHDKVYAMRSFCSDLKLRGRSEGPLVPDYAQPWQQLYVEAAKYFLEIPLVFYRSEVLDHGGLIN